MSDQLQVIRDFSPEEQARWDRWLQAEVAKMIADPESAVFRALIEIIAINRESHTAQIEKDVGAFVGDELKTLRAEIRTQREQDKAENRTWIDKIFNR